MSQAKTSRNDVMINPDDAVMLLIDHQSGLFQLVKDIPVHYFASYPLQRI